MENFRPFLKPSIFLVMVRYCLMACTLAEAATTTNINITTDQSALLALKSNLFNLDPSLILSKNWSSSTSVCNWVGVTCGLRHKRVTGLNLSNMGLEGYLVPRLGNLSFLVSLDLSHNNFQGKLPQELTHLRRLKLLNLNFNNIGNGDNIPSWFGDFFPQLQWLSLRNNSFAGVIPSSLCNMSKLEYLDLTTNLLHGRIPPEIGNLQNLQALGLQRNQLTGSIPSGLFNLSKLEILALTENMLSGSLPDSMCRGFPMIEKIYLGSNELYGNIPANMSSCSKIWLLGLAFNEFEGFIPSEMGNMQALQTLGLGSNNLTGEIPPTLFNISTLQTLSLEDNQLTGNLPSNLGHSLPNLEHLLLSVNNLRSESPELNFISSLSNCRYLIRLQIYDNPFDATLPSPIGNLSASLDSIYASRMGIIGSIPHEIGNLSKLTTLTLSGNHFIGSVPESLGNMQSLQALALQQNKINGTFPNVMCNMVSLYYLSMSENQIGGIIPDCIVNLTSLRILELDDNKFNSTIPANLWLLNDLQTLNMSSNFFSGDLAHEIGNLKAAIEIYFSNNQFSGIIPSTIGNLITLNSLSLDHNEFRGPIPELLTQIVSLESLDLSYNNLSGQIPSSLQKLQHLLRFNVSFNDLSGAIPSDGPFKNFSSPSFMSNKGLCGDSKYNVSPCPLIRVKRSNRKLKIIVPVISVATVVAVLVLSITYVYSKYQKKQGSSLRSFNWIIPTPLRFSYYELLEATERYNESRLLGMGSFGSVYRATLRNGKDVAVKVFNSDSERSCKSFEVECKVLRELRHKNLCKVIGSCSNQDFKALVLEYMPSGSLEKWLYSHNYFLDLRQRISIMIDVVYALEYLHCGHSMTIIHCDLKPSNVLLNEDMVAHLSDFGISKLLDDGENATRTMTLATMGYIAPEFGTDGLVSTCCDVYSYGIMLMEVFTREKPNDEKFTEDLSLRSWVEDSMPNGIIHILDSNLLRSDEERVNEKLYCLSSVFELALHCSMESPRERINIKDVRVALQKIKLQLQAYY